MHANPWVIPAVGALLCWGVSNFLPKITVRYMTPLSAIVYEALGVIIVAASVLVFIGFKPEVEPKGAVLAFLTGAIGFVGALFLLGAVTKGKVSLVVPMVTLYPLVTVILAFLILKEPISSRHLLGMLFAFTAIGLLSTTN